MICKKCGNEVGSAKFCPECGTNMVEEIPSESKKEEIPLTTPAESENVANINSNNNGKKKGSFSTSTGFVVLMLLLFFPVGLVLMWSYGKFNKVVRIIISLFFGFIVFSGIIGGLDDSDKQTTSTSENMKTTSAKEKKVKEKVLTSIAAVYTGDTSEGILIDDNTANLIVSATYDDYSSENVTGWKISNPATLAAEQTQSFKVTYKDKSCDMQVVCTTISANTFKNNCQDISYEELARNPDSYIGSNIRLTGQIIQVQEDGSNAVFRVNVTPGDYDIWSDTIIISYTYKDGESRFLENDIVSFYGQSAGLYTYTTVMGSDMTIPSATVEYMDLVQQ